MGMIANAVDDLRMMDDKSVGKVLQTVEEQLKKDVEDAKDKEGAQRSYNNMLVYLDANYDSTQEKEKVHEDIVNTLAELKFEDNIFKNIRTGRQQVEDLAKQMQEISKNKRSRMR